MKQLLELNICPSGKQSFQNEDHAQGAVERGWRRQISLRAYRCPACKHWHVTRLKAPKMRIKHAQSSGQQYKRGR